MEDFTATLLREHPSTVELLGKFAPVIFAFLAAVIASMIAYGQYLTARKQRQIAQDKLKLDFLRRDFLSIRQQKLS